MGDVVIALSRAVQEAGHDVEALIPKFDIIDYNQVASYWEQAWMGCMCAWMGCMHDCLQNSGRENTGIQARAGGVKRTHSSPAYSPFLLLSFFS